jgi:preprotein translocase subunit YajC
MFELLAQETTAQPNPLAPFLMFAIIGVGLYFVMIRPQKRKMQMQRDLLNQLEVGDEVVTAGGIFGQILDIDDDEDVVTVEIAPGTSIRMLRGGISRRLADDDEGDDGFDPDDEDEDQDEEADRSS